MYKRQSWYRGDASATAVFELTGDTRYSYTGSWCAPGLVTSWNGSWRISGEHGSASWDGDGEPVVERVDNPPVSPGAGSGPGPDSRPVGAGGPSLLAGVAGALAAFSEALRTGVTPHGEVHENVPSLLMVEAAVEAADSRRRVLVDDVLARAHAEAMATEAHPDVARVLSSWSSAADVLGLAFGTDP